MDKEVRLRLIRPSLQEYLSIYQDLVGRAHSTVAETCLTYLNFRRVKGLWATCSPTPERAVSESATIYWGTHMKIESSESDGEKLLTLELFS